MAALTDIDVANQALQMISARSTITSFTQSNSVEAANVNQIYYRIRDQVMGMAWWNFARRTALLSLMKAAPGTPENTASQSSWSSANPAPPWLYEYRYPDDCITFHGVTPQPTANIIPPLTSQGYSYNALEMWPGPIAAFQVASDFNVTATITAATKASPIAITCTNSFANGDRITIEDVVGMVELNANSYLVASRTGSGFSLTDLNGTAIDSTLFTTYTSGGSALATPVRCILTNVEYALGVYIAQMTNPAMWPNQFVQAFAAALAGWLAFPITGKRDLRNDCLMIANSLIIEARKSDGNEGLTVQDYTPDWIQIRDADGYYPGVYPYAAPYPPLFSLAV